ncbi:MAG: nuclear transport factor 2 family protein [Rhodospirillaceae bacterium]|nr:nuclear transport factor 2 family protein [Rhodospirillaceae bacterium]
MNNQQIANLQIARVLDEAALRKLAELYAQGADRRDKAVWASIITADCVIDGPGFKMDGRDQILGGIDILGQMFVMTQHRVHNQVVVIDGDNAKGETYCVADHLTKENGKTNILVWNIRYQDTYRREEGRWLIAGRTLIIDWEEKRTIG